MRTTRIRRKNKRNMVSTGLLHFCSRLYYICALLACSLCCSCWREESIFFCCQKKIDKKKTSQERRRSRHLSQLPVGSAGLLSCNHSIRGTIHRWPSLPTLANLAIRFAHSKDLQRVFTVCIVGKTEIGSRLFAESTYYIATQPSGAVVARRSKTTKRLSRVDASTRRCSAVCRRDSTGAILVRTICMSVLRVNFYVWLPLENKRSWQLQSN